MTSTVKAGAFSDLVTLTPKMLGFHPSESLVAIALSGTRSIGVLRLDLPDPQDHAHFAEKASEIVHRIPDVDGIIVIVYTSSLPTIFEPVALSFIQALDLPTATLGWVSPTRYAEYGDGATICNVADLKDYGPEVEVSASNEPEPLPEVGEFSYGFEDVGDPVDDMLAVLEQGVTPNAAARYALMSNVPSLRDTALITLLRGEEAGREAAAAQERFEQGEPYVCQHASIMWGGGEIDPSRLELLLDLARHAAAIGKSYGFSGGPLAVAAWASWALGKSTHASKYAAGVPSDSRGYGLAEVVQSYVDSGHLPAWAFSRR